MQQNLNPTAKVSIQPQPSASPSLPHLDKLILRQTG
jgi:hypothetical protein